MARAELEDYGADTQPVPESDRTPECTLRAAERRSGSQKTEHNVVGVRVAATKHESFLEAALDRHLGRSRQPSRSLRSFLIHAIESLESRRYVGGLKAQAGQRKCSHAVRFGERRNEQVPRTDVARSRSCSPIARDPECMPGAFGSSNTAAKSIARPVSTLPP